MPGLAADPPYTACAFAPDGQQVLVASQAGLRVLSWPGLQSKRQLPAPCDQIHDLAFSPDGRCLAVAGGSPAAHGTLVCLAWPSMERSAACSPSGDVVYRAVWSPDGRQLAVACADRHVVLFSKTLEELARFRDHSAPVLCAAFLADGRTLVSAGVDRSLRVWDVVRKESLRAMENHTAPVLDLQLRPGIESGPSWVASAGEDLTIRFWQPSIGRLVRFARVPDVPAAITWTRDGRLVAAACRDGHVRWIDPVTVQVVADQPALEVWPWALAMAPDDRRVIVVGERHAVAVVDRPAETADPH